MNTFNKGDKVTHSLKNEKGFEKHHGKKPFYIITSVKNQWLRFDDYIDGYHYRNFTLYIDINLLDDDLFNLE